MSDTQHPVREQFLTGLTKDADDAIKVINTALHQLTGGCKKHSKELIESHNLATRLKGECSELTARNKALATENARQQELIVSHENQKKTTLSEASSLKAALNKQESQTLSLLKKIHTDEKEHKAFRAQDALSLDTLKTEIQNLLERDKEHKAMSQALTNDLTGWKEKEIIWQQITEKTHTKHQMELSRKTIALEQAQHRLSQLEHENHNLSLSSLEQTNELDKVKAQTEKQINELSQASDTISKVRQMFSEIDLLKDPSVLKDESVWPAPHTAFARKLSTEPAKKQQSTSDKSLSREESFEQWLNPATEATHTLLEESA